MALAVRSTSSASFTTGSVVITKPSGLAVGDLMVVCSYVINGIHLTEPVGFNVINSVSNTAVGRLYYKFADSSDVAASNFTFTNGGGGNAAAHMLAITGANTTTPASISATATGSSASATFSLSVTPDENDSLLIFHVGAYVGSGSSITSSGYSIVTSNPSWTESVDQNVNSSNSGQMAVAYASRSAKTATGDASVTFTSGSAFFGMMLVVRPQIQVTISETSTLTENIIPSYGKTITDTTSTAETITTTKGRVWRKETKPSTTWRTTNK